VFHVTTRGNRGGRIFLTDRDRVLFLGELGRVLEETGWYLLAFCLMGTHYHLAVETPQPNLGAGMQLLNGRYAREFNRRRGARGHLFERRYHSVKQERDEQLLELMRYIALNPVRAGLCDRPEEWKWGSHNALLGRGHAGFVDVERTLDRFAAWGGEGCRRYEEFVESALLTPAR
jgi:putative transposase